MLRSWIVPSALLLAACPQANQAAPDPAAGKVAPPPVADGRVVVNDGDLYPAKGGVVPPPPPPATSLGTGLSDETNGKCRLYAPELPNPACCERQLGFDVAVVQAACDLKIYMGESFHGTCGYHFVADATATGMPARWFRLSAVAEKTPKEAAEAQDRRSRRVDGYVAATPIPGLDGAWWSEADDLHWAFIPGWSTVRMFTWSDRSCKPEGVMTVLKKLITTPEIPAGTERTSLVPGSLMSPAGPV